MSFRILLWIALLSVSTIGCTYHRHLATDIEIKASQDKEKPPGEIAFFFINDENTFDSLKQTVMNEEEHGEIDQYIKNGSADHDKIQVSTEPREYVKELQFNEYARNTLVAIYPFFFPERNNFTMKLNLTVPEEYKWGVVFYRSANLQTKKYKYTFQEITPEDYSSWWWFSDDYAAADIFCDYENQSSIEIKK